MHRGIHLQFAVKCICLEAFASDLFVPLYRCFLPRSPVPEMRRIYSDLTASARKKARKGNEWIGREIGKWQPSDEEDSTKLRINDKVASRTILPYWRNLFFFSFRYLLNFREKYRNPRRNSREEAKDEEIKIWNEVKVCHSRVSPSENFVSNVEEPRRERKRERGVWGKKSWKKNRYLSTDSARGKEFEKGNFA